MAQAPQYRRELDDGLLLRWASDDDCAGIVQLYSHVFRDAADEPPNLWIASYTRDTMSGRHPLIGPGDFAVVEERATSRIVAATCLLRATWSYAGIPFAVGRPELVASHPDYRNRGLVRALFELIHARSTARGDMLQGITGIPFYFVFGSASAPLLAAGVKRVFWCCTATNRLHYGILQTPEQMSETP